MSDFPVYSLPPGPTIAPGTQWMLPGIGFNIDYAVTNIATSGAWPTANKAFYLPFVIPEPVIVTQLATWNGATASGNIDIGIYDSSGTRIVSAGSTAQSGTNTLQTFNITDTTLGRGAFYLGIAKNDTTGTIFRSATQTVLYRVWGILEQTSAFALPATATFALLSANFVPWGALVLSPQTVI